MADNYQDTTFPSIDFYSSEGFEISLRCKQNKIERVIPRTGLINNYGLISPKMGNFPEQLRQCTRLTKPLKRIGEELIEISFNEALDIIATAIKNANPNENAFFAGARLSNEMLYQIQKLSRTVFRSNNIGSFHYFEQNKGWYDLDKNDNVQLNELEGCSAITILGNGVAQANPLIVSLLQQIRNEKNIPVTSIHILPNECEHVDKQIIINSYYSFIKAINHYLVFHDLQQGIFVQALSEEFNDYKMQLLKEEYGKLLQQAGVSDEIVFDFVVSFLKEPNPVVIFSESDITEHCAREVLNLFLLSGKNGVPSSGVLDLKEKNNTQGLFDMGINSRFGVGRQIFDDRYLTQLKTLWNFDDIDISPVDVERSIMSGASKNVFIFGEDPIGCVKDESHQDILKYAEFIVVQDYFLTETAKIADIILPDSFPFETGGSFTNTTKIIQQFSKVVDSPLEYDNLEQLAEIAKRFNIQTETSPDMIFLEYVQFLPTGCSGKSRHKFIYTKQDSQSSLFKAGCDALMNSN
ncbi:MAG: molybdopterin-dependent oxidoreductase [Bacteroidales bacterium]|jgi:formate dehydrogenase major subunit|nr:molybdopterin-dependent oxidoreductase [Bacteroidales bacterium]